MSMHLAVPADPMLSESTCWGCGAAVHGVMGGNGPTWVHTDTGVKFSRRTLIRDMSTARPVTDAAPASTVVDMVREVRALIWEWTDVADEASGDDEHRAATDVVEATSRLVDLLLPARPGDDQLATCCHDCHLFVEENAAYGDGPGIAPWIHLHRGTPEDEAIEETHEATQGQVHRLGWWRVFGPDEMRARFTD